MTLLTEQSALCSYISALVFGKNSLPPRSQVDLRGIGSTTLRRVARWSSNGRALDGSALSRTELPSRSASPLSSTLWCVFVKKKPGSLEPLKGMIDQEVARSHLYKRYGDCYCQTNGWIQVSFQLHCSLPHRAIPRPNRTALLYITPLRAVTDLRHLYGHAALPQTYNSTSIYFHSG
jgi:hypothetical protein